MGQCRSERCPSASAVALFSSAFRLIARYPQGHVNWRAALAYTPRKPEGHRDDRKVLAYREAGAPLLRLALRLSLLLLGHRRRGQGGL